MDERRAGTPASHTHRYTSYLTEVKRNSVYAGTPRLPGRHTGDKLLYWGRTSDEPAPNVRPTK